jgi:hypothetical protein
MSAAREPVSGTLDLNWRKDTPAVGALSRTNVPSPSTVAASAPTDPVAPTPSVPKPTRRGWKLDDDARIARRMAALAAMRRTWPLVFDLDMPVPLAIGIHVQVRDALGISDEATGDAMGWWCTRPAYRAVLAEGGARYGLDAAPDGVVSDEHRRNGWTSW